MCAREASYSPEVSSLLGVWILRPWSSRSRIDHPAPLASDDAAHRRTKRPSPSRGGWENSAPDLDRRLRVFLATLHLPLPAGGAKCSPDRHPTADSPIEHLRRLLDPLSGGVERVGDRGLG